MRTRRRAPPGAERSAEQAAGVPLGREVGGPADHELTGSHLRGGLQGVTAGSC